MGILEDLAAVPSYFQANAKPDSPLSYQALQTRRKIAEQLMGKRSPFPKTFGEGLTYAGERIGDAINMSGLDAAERAREAGLTDIERNAPPSGVAAGGVENRAVAPAAPPAARPIASVPAGNLPVGNSAPLEAGTPGAPLERASPEEGGYNFLDAQALAGGRGPRFRTERNAEVGSRVGFDKAIQGINPEMQARMLAAYEAMPDNIKQTFAYNEGSRPRDYQQYLYDTRSGRGPVAPPGTSRHEAGQAIDVDRGAALDWLKANGAQFGLEGISGDYPHLQMARSGAAFGNPNSPATLPIPGQSAVPARPPGSRDAMASAIVNPSPPGSMVNTPAPLSGGTATPEMLSPGGFTQPSAPVRTAALTGGVASDAGPQAALPPQTPLDPANNVAIPSPIPLAPPDVRTPGVQTAQAGGPAIPALPANMPPGFEMPRPVPPPVPEERPKNARELYGERILAQGIRRGDPQMQAMGQDYVNREKAVRDHLYARDVEAYKNEYAHYSAKDQLWLQTQIAKQDKSLGTIQKALEVAGVPGKLAREATKEEIANQAAARKLQEETPVEQISHNAPDPNIGTPLSRQRTGIPELPPIPPGTVPEKVRELHATSIAKDSEAYGKALPKFNQMIQTINEARAHPGYKSGLGVLGTIARNTPQTEAYGFNTLVDQLKGKTFLQGYQDVRGGGQISNIEGTKAELAQARLDPKQREVDFRRSLNDLESAVRGDLETMQRKMNAPVTAWQRSPDEDPAPDKGQPGMRTIGGVRVPVIYIGGDPASDNSYKRVR